jgi:hypothetical protein
MPKFLTQAPFLIGAGVVLALMLLLNPSADRHREHIRDSINGRSQFEGAFGVGQVTAFMARYHSLGLVSYTTVNDKIESIGVLGAVFVFD